jgi:hypothetical protein
VNAVGSPKHVRAEGGICASNISTAVIASSLDPITATISDFVKLTGVSRSKIYELLKEDELESIYIDGRRLILIDSYRRLIERRRGVAKPASSRPGNQP